MLIRWALLTRMRVSSDGGGRALTIVSYVVKPTPPFQLAVGLLTT